MHRKPSFCNFFFKSYSQLLFYFFHQNFSSQSISHISFPIRQLVPQKHWLYWLAPSSICRDWKQSGHDHLSLGNHQLRVQYSIHLIYHNEIQTELPHFGCHIFHTRKPSIILTKNINVLPLTVWNFQHSFLTFKQHLIFFSLTYVTGRWLSNLLLRLHCPYGPINRFTMGRHYNQCLILVHSQSTL